MRGWGIACVTVVFLCITGWMVFIGRYGISPHELWDILGSLFQGRDLSEDQQRVAFVLLSVRLPRIIAAMLVGGALAVSGASYQALFMNPLVSPNILGVLAGASFGAGLGIVVFSSWIATQLLAFLFGCIAVAAALFFAAFFRRRSLVILLLGGMVSSSLFTSLTSLFKFVADPNRQLPQLVYWLMGSFAHVDADVLIWVGPPMLLCLVYLCVRGKTVNLLSMGEEEAAAMGVSVKAERMRLILASTLVSALTVLLAGIVAWVGLVIPHVMRFIVGPNNRVLLPASALGGASFLLVTDAVVRSVYTAELPLGVFTSLVSLPVFTVALYYSRGIWK